MYQAGFRQLDHTGASLVAQAVLVACRWQETLVLLSMHGEQATQSYTSHVYARVVLLHDRVVVSSKPSQSGYQIHAGHATSENRDRRLFLALRKYSHWSLDPFICRNVRQRFKRSRHGGVREAQGIWLRRSLFLHTMRILSLFSLPLSFVPLTFTRYSVYTD